MALSYRRREPSAQYFDSWHEYLDSWGEGGERSMCRALTYNYDDLVRPQWLAAINDVRDLEAAIADGNDTDDAQEALAESRLISDYTRKRVGFPWVTPVLGSGCLSAAEGPEARAIELVPAEVATAASDWGSLPDDVSKSDAIKRFADALVRSKVGKESAPIDSHDSDLATESDDRSEDIDGREKDCNEGEYSRRLEVAGVAAHALLCSYLLTKLYFEIGALKEELIESLSAPLQFDPSLDGPSPRGAEIYDSLAKPLLVELSNLKSAIRNRKGRNLQFVSKFADAIRTDIAADMPQIRGSDAQLMTEIAWHFMTEGTPQYPGWSDLLVLLGFAFDSTDREHRWPHLTDLTTARKELRGELLKTTDLSWKTRTGTVSLPDSSNPSTSKRDQLYDSVADLLIAQASLKTPIRSLDEQSAKEQLSDEQVDEPGVENQAAYPAAVAFVTSFDLELEMALLARGTRFVLVMPFYIRGVGSKAAAGYVWLRTTVHPAPKSRTLSSDDLRRLTHPSGWSLVSNEYLQDERLDIPVVVRLAGSPLIEGPDAIHDPGEWAEKLDLQLGAGHQLVGTVLLDEHTALQQWAADLGTLKSAENTKDRLGLPRTFITGSDAQTDARFWFLLGVQLNDDAVRHRTAAVIAAADLRGQVGDAERTASPRRTGVVINRRSTPNQRDVFLWQGLDVVRSTYEEAIPALAHAAHHAARPDVRRLFDDDCRLTETLA